MSELSERLRRRLLEVLELVADETEQRAYQAAVPLVDNIANMQFTYDTYNSNGTLLNADGNGGETALPPVSPSLIRKVNIAHLTIHGQLYGAKSSLMATQGFQSLDVQTSISARNMSYNNRY